MDLTAQDCLKKLEEVEDKIEKLTSLLDKEEKDLLPSEKKKVKDFDANLAKLDKEKEYWQDALKEAQKQQQGQGNIIES
jgi:16S rRNA G1207 methylase RsmC